MNGQRFKLTIASLYLIVAYGCSSNIQFQAIESPTQSPQNIPTEVFKDEIIETVKPTEQVFDYQQNVYDQNRTAVSFQVTKPNGQLLESLGPQDLVISENDMPVNRFNLTHNSENFRQIVDIVFAVDVTASMKTTIEIAKTKLVNFINQSRKSGYRTRMCLITFGDYTVKKCDKFYDNNPDDPETLAQVAQLIAEIGKLKSLTGSQDPGGKDKNENPMRALIDASKSPWATNNQRFLILITDDGFLYSPGNQGTVGALAPKYSEITDALKTSQMKVFAATPDLAGYNKNFGKEASIVALSQGQWFNYVDLISGKISLDTILNSIITNVNTTFIAEYVSEENNLQADLPLSLRKPKITLANAELGEVSPLQMKSNMPNGHEKYKDEFNFASNNVNLKSVKVYIDNLPITSGFSLTDDGKIKFIIPPKAGSKIQIKYIKKSIKDSFEIKPILIKNVAKVVSIDLSINDYTVDKSLFSVIKSDEGTGYLIIDPETLSQDKYDIQKNNQLQIKVKISYDP